MNKIDPRSPCDSFACITCGEDHRLGELDCDGEFVGWIECPDGPGFIDREQRDMALVGGTLIDEFMAWNRCGGCLVAPPDVDAAMEAEQALESSRGAILAYLASYAASWAQREAERARWN
jgi:hypothetical protein